MTDHSRRPPRHSVGTDDPNYGTARHPGGPTIHGVATTTSCSGPLDIEPIRDQPLTLGDTVVFPVRIRREYYSNSVQLKLHDLPRGVTPTHPVAIAAKQEVAQITLKAEATAQTGQCQVTLEARALGHLGISRNFTLILNKPKQPPNGHR